MNQEIAGNETRIEIRNCKETEFLNRIKFPYNLDVADNKTLVHVAQECVLTRSNPVTNKI